MSVNEMGREGEEKARLFLKRWGCEETFQADWLFKRQGKWYVAEVKNKQKFEPPPFWGHGLDIRQVRARLKFQQETGIRCLFLVFDPDGEMYLEYLDNLEQGRKFTTRNMIRVYPLERFKRMDWPF